MGGAKFYPTDPMRLAKDNSSSRTKSEVVVRFVSGRTTTSKKETIYLHPYAIVCLAKHLQ